MIGHHVLLFTWIPVEVGRPERLAPSIHDDLPAPVDDHQFIGELAADLGGSGRSLDETRGGAAGREVFEA